MLILSSRVNPDLPDSVSCSLSVYEPVGCLGNAGHVQYRTLGFVFVTASIIMCMCVGVCWVCAYKCYFSRKTSNVLQAST